MLSFYCLVLAAEPYAKEQITFVAQERIPYIGFELPNQGYVHQVVFEAFQRVGYHVDVTYYPPARAKKLADEGKVDGIFPVYYSDSMVDSYFFSDPFPGDVIGLLRHKSGPNDIVIHPEKSIMQNLKELSEYQFSLVRGSSAEQLLGKVSFLNKQYALNDLLNIDKLYAKRMDFAVIDKFTAGDLIVSKRPHMIGELEFVYPALEEQKFYVAFNKKTPNSEKRLTLFNLGLSQMVADGRLQQILAEHGFYSQPNLAIHEKDKTRLVVGTVNNTDMLILKNLSSHFEKLNPTISIEWKVLDEITLRQRLLTDIAISAGQFDVMTIGSFETPIWANKGWLEAIGLTSQDFELNDLIDTVKADISIDDKVYALPFYSETLLTYYRSDLFKNANLKMPSQPTYQQILEYAKKLHAPDEGVYGICLRGKGGWGANMALISTMVNSYGGRWFDMNWTPQIVTKQWHDAVSMYVDLVTKYGPPHASDYNYLDNLKLFSEGKCAIWVDASTATSVLKNPTKSSYSHDTEITQAPIGKYKKGSQWIWTWSLAIPSSSKHKEAAMTFAQWATSVEYTQLVADKYGWLSIPQGVRKSIYQNENYLEAASFAPTVFDTMQKIDTYNTTLEPKPYSGIQFVRIPEFSSLGDQVGDLIERALRKEVSVRYALQRSQDLIEKQMHASGYYKSSKPHR